MGQEKMKIKIQQFLATNYSWAIVGQNIARALIKQGHDVHLFSTNGLIHFPADLTPYLKDWRELKEHKKLKTDKSYDMQLSYTAMLNFGSHLANGTKNRFGIWNYETTVIPTGFAKYYKYCDKMLPSSEFAKKIFADNGVPEERLVVVPHGINVEEYSNKSIYPLKTKKKYKILSNIAQPHIRKNIEGVFEAFGKAFTKEDDVCLVCKIHTKKIKENTTKPVIVKNKRALNKLNKKLESEKPKEKVMAFDIDFWGIYNKFCKDYPKHAEVEIITEFLDTVTPLYNACDIVFSMTRAECYWLPGVEALATDKLVVVSGWGGQLDFLNDNNSLLISGKEVRAPKEMQYWTTSPLAKMFEPSVDDAADKLKLAVKDYDNLMNKFRPVIKEQLKTMTWDNVATQIINLCE